MPRRVRAIPPSVRREQDGTGQAYGPVKHGHDESLLLVPQIIEEVRADHEPGHERHEDDPRARASAGPPARHDVRAPQQAERPDRHERERPVEAEPPGLARGNAPRPARPVQQVMEEEPEGSGAAPAGAADVYDDPD